ncbi:methyltransferase (TIGR00027 family) [Kribbella aluminosa]|uniref:S-adenosyl-L-methionine-dependent methyltransferase n=1 Tax=Kribbella aluminosa TaxID=416017 RepID=A0ABS4UNG5_9ACTN|nr:class I SAM-dependent methyltransferase [Kribbella aluminosa]MBP2353180.1 methyltransferase (TIGR00027 family) [Kribbella aluminosa]
MTFTRLDGDSWDLASGVGTTATMSAAARAVASRTEPRLIDDPFAAPLVQAVGVDFIIQLASGDVPIEQTWIDIAKIRTRFYDEYFVAATSSGITQVVILAAGLDSRAYRLPWPTGTVVYELDQPEVIDFKTRTLAALGAGPTADRRPVAADLREDWPAALRSAGFDPTQPTAWSAEGLLGYLPPDAQDRLLDTITDLSAPASRVATESKPTPTPTEEANTKQGLQTLADTWRTETDMPSLRYFGPRNEAAPYLTAAGWTLTTTTVQSLLTTNNLTALDPDPMNMGAMQYVTGIRAEKSRDRTGSRV